MTEPENPDTGPQESGQNENAQVYITPTGDGAIVGITLGY